jgi:quinol monooxygenase YgiN
MEEECPMIFIVVKQPVRAKCADEWVALVQKFSALTRAEPGNISYDWYRSPEDPNVWVLIEAYRDAEAGEAHVTSDHFKAAMAEMPRLLAAAPEIINVEVAGETWSQVSEGS